MEQLNAILQSELCMNLLSALLHSLWQGLIIAGILLLYLKSKKAQDANTRYTASLIALASILICLLFTWSILNYKPAPVIQENTIINESVAQIDIASTEPQNNILKTNHSEIQNTSTGFNWKPPVIGIWLTGVLIMLFRAIYIIAGGAKLQVQCDELKDEHILEIIENLRKNLRINRKIKVAASDYITVPGVIGFFSPLLLLPVSLITGVPDEALKAILAHELAHIRRYDYLINFCQMVIEAILFFNPAVWWISRQIRIEREVCCDNAGIASIGRRIRYAEVLIQWAQKMKDRDMETVEMAIGFGKKNDNSGMLERIKRIVSSDHRPGLKVSWHIAAITLVLSIATLAALWQGTNMTVAFAGNLLTPQERIDKISEISQDYGYNKDKYGEESKLQISGIIKTWDNKPLPKDAQIMLHISQPRYGESISISISKANPFSFDGTFSREVKYGTIYVLAAAEGYAPAYIGPLEPEPGNNIENVELVLQEGYPVTIKVIDEKGNPVESANITAGYPVEGSSSNSIALTTDINGIAIIEHAVDRKATLTINADGYELYQAREISFKPDEINILKLTKSKPTTGTIISKITGEPVEGASIKILITIADKSNGSYNHGRHGEPDALSDEKGMFSLTKLRSDCRYLVLIEADGYNRQYLSDLRAGTENIKIELEPSKIIQGRIIGDLSKLKGDKNGNPIIIYSQKYRFENHSSTDETKQMTVTIIDGIGHFEITECWGQQVVISAGDESLSVNIDEDSLDDVLIDLNPKNVREVVLNFNVPEGNPDIEGQVRIDYSRPEYISMKPAWLDIVDNEARIKIPVPAKFKYSVSYDNMVSEGKAPVGYWFNEITSIDIPDDNEPYVINVPVYPAGAIYGTIRRPDGTIIEDAQIAVRVVEKPEVSKQSYISITASVTDKGTFNVTPLPFGGRYGIIAYEDRSFGVSEVIEINENNPVVNIDIEVPDGVEIEGQLVDANDNPVRIPVTIDIDIKQGEISHGFSGPEKWPDEDGRFVYENVNPGHYGKCSIVVKGRDGFRNAIYEIKDLTKPIIIRLKKGLRASGIILDEETGWPIPGVEVYAFYSKNNNGIVQYERLEAEGSTNDKGEFVFSNMSELTYEINLSGGANYADPFNPIKLTGGQKEPIIIKADIPEWSNLKPRKPD